MNLDPQPALLPGRRMYEELLEERFSRSSAALWWPTPRAHRDAGAMQYMRRLELEEAAQDDDEEVADAT